MNFIFVYQEVFLGISELREPDRRHHLLFASARIAKPGRANNLTDTEDAFWPGALL
jgi:hypothetical protein